MKEIQEILKRIDSLSPKENAVLATVIDVKGSSYRLPGAKMLILQNGESFGTVSGGCLEADVMQRAETVMKTGETQIFTYDTTTNEDSVFGFNMGCRGVIRILLEPIRDNPYVDFLRDCFHGNPGVSATLLTQEKLGQRFFLSESRTLEAKNEAIDATAKEVLARSVSQINEFDFGEVFFEYLSPPVKIKIFGAGADAVPLAEIAKDIGWHVTVVDHRQSLANETRFKNPDSIIISRPEDISKNLSLDHDSVAVVMTHNYDHDKIILEALFKSNLKYIGLLGPKIRTGNILRELREKGVEMSAKNLNALHAPVGLDTGAQMPETIALAILAEIQASLSHRKGGFLKDRKESIYGRD